MHGSVNPPSPAPTNLHPASMDAANTSRNHGLGPQHSYGATSNNVPSTAALSQSPQQLSPQQQKLLAKSKPRPTRYGLRHSASNGSLSSSSISSSVSSVYGATVPYPPHQQQDRLSIQQGTKWQTKVREGQGIVVGFLRRRIPILGWLVFYPGYNWRANTAEDFFAGITISAVIIPQSLSYAMLASLPPAHGLYTSLVPTIVYAIFGTSKHMSTGTFAITSLLLGQFAHKILSDQGYEDSSDPDSEYYRRYLPLCLTLTFVIGGIQILMSMARLGRWTSKHLLPTALVSGFNTASAFHIGTHQLKHWLGMKPPRESGVFSMIKSWIWIVGHFWQETSWPSLSMGLAAMILMYLLQRLEYYRRARSDSVLNVNPVSPPSSLSASTPLLPSDRPGFSTSPSLHHPTFEDGARPNRSHSRGQGTRLGQGWTRGSRSRRANIVPKAVSDQALLTMQDVALESSGDDYDTGASSRSSPATLSAVRVESADTASSVRSPPPQSPLHSYGSSVQGPAGLANTGALGRVPKTATPPVHVHQYKTFRRSPSNPSLIDSNRQRISFESAEGLDRSFANEASPRRASIVTFSGASDSEGSSSCSSAPYSSVGAAQHDSTQQQISTAESPQEVQESAQDRTCIPKVHFPIPDILICVVVFTIATVVFDLDGLYGIEVIGAIPTGLPTPTWPPVAMTEGWTWETWKPLIWPGILMAMVVYVMSLSVAKHFGREYGYEVDADQEMLAIGAGSLFGSCFGAYACTGNLTRSAILAQLGSRTPLASLVGALMVLMTLLWFTALFTRIPNTILATIVLVSLKSLMGHTIEAKRLWRVGRRKEAFIWWSTFMAVILFSIEIGLGVGIATVVLFKLYKHGSRWKQRILRSVKQSVLYQRIMLMLGLQSPLHTTVGRGLYTGDDDDDY
ncbi:hypothetical protein EMPS_08393 [Entomortierella parvispora]|uniref:SLC26A/SulP transporter domain-containing protein n=1 Tax=Entomortierella parvispora TaxID=205924 RepID=A0A9P3HG24_9FUNG|nr:hypothetical protein EMPS_08393 [Entomortierella parvispora]